MPAREWIIAEQLAPYLAPGSQVLEIGAGKGLVARALQQRTQVAMTLLDVVDYNQTELPLHLYDGRRIPFADGAFDLALLIFVLHHTSDPLMVLGEALRVSRQGVLVIENDVRGWLKRRITRALDSLPHLWHGVPICYHTRSAAEWRRELERLAAVETLSRFQIDYFWCNVIFRLSARGLSR